MAKARDMELRRDILSTLDEKAVCTFEDITKHLAKLNIDKKPHTIRYTVSAMVKEGTLKIMERGQHNKAYYVKGMFPNKTLLQNPKGEVVGLQEFIATLDGLESHPLLSDMALKFIKHWMMNSIAIADKKAYYAKTLNPPVAKKCKSQLEDFKKAVELLHRFVKTFMDADIWSDAGQERVLKELAATGVIDTIVDKYGRLESNAERERNQDD